MRHHIVLGQLIVDCITFAKWVGNTTAKLQKTATLVTGEGEVYGFDPAFVGISAAHCIRILPPIIASPIVVAPNESVLIEAGDFLSSDGYFNGDNITASLMASNGTVIASQELVPTYIFTPPNLYVSVFYTYFHIPAGVKPGYYTLYINVTKYCRTTTSNNGYKAVLGGYTGYQIYISPYAITPKVKVQDYVFQGQKVTFFANITYENGTEVKYGIFTALVFPKQLQHDYQKLSEEYGIVYQVRLTYNATLGLWEGSYIVPSVNSLGNATYLNPGYYSGEFDIYVQGLTYNGISTVTDDFTPFVVLPYTLIEGKNLDMLIPVNSALEDDNITYNGTLTNVIMLGVNRLHGIVTLEDVNVTGTLIIYNSNVTIIGGYANNIIAVNSSIVLASTVVNNLNLENSHVETISSRVVKVSPTLPKEVIQNKPGNYTGVINVSVDVIGEDIENVTFYLNGIPVYVAYTNGTITFPLHTCSYPDGNYRLTVVAYQKDGLSTSSSVSFNFYNNLEHVSKEIKEVNDCITNIHHNITNTSKQLSQSITSVSHSLCSKYNVDLGVGIAGIILALIAIALSIVRRK